MITFNGDSRSWPVDPERAPQNLYREPRVGKSRENAVERHPDRAAIEADLIRKVPLRRLEKRYGIHYSILSRHGAKLRREQPKLVAAIAATDWGVSPAELEKLRLETADGWLKQVRAQLLKLQRVQDRAIEQDKYVSVAQIAAQVNKLFEILGRATNELAEHSTKIENATIVLPVVYQMRTTILMALRSFPDPRAAVLSKLREIEADDAPEIEATATEVIV